MKTLPSLAVGKNNWVTMACIHTFGVNSYFGVFQSTSDFNVNESPPLPAYGLHFKFFAVAKLKGLAVNLFQVCRDISGKLKLRFQWELSGKMGWISTVPAISPVTGTLSPIRFL